VRENVAGLDVFRFCSAYHSTDRDIRSLLTDYNVFITLNEDEDCDDSVPYHLGSTNLVIEIREVLG